MIGIYKITNLINEHSYIGQSQHIEERWKEHIRCSQNPNSQSYNYPLQKAFRKYGMNNFSFNVLEECRIEDLSSKEKYWMERSNCYYNQTANTTVNAVSWKLTSEQIAEIQYMLINNDKVYYEELAKSYGISVQTISDINTGRTWYNEKLSYPLRKAHHKTLTFCKDCGKPISHNAIRCNRCRGIQDRKVVNLPSRDELKKLIRTTSFTKIGEKYNVSDNAVRKWCDKYGLPRKVSIIKKISNTDWENL